MLPSDHLNDLLIDIGRSLLQYAGESWPWTNTDEAAERDAVERMVAEQRETVLQLAELLDERKHRITYGQYPSEYTSLHYVALDYLLDQLVDEQRTLAAELKSATEEATGDTGAQPVLAAATEQAARHAEELAALVAQRKAWSTTVA